MNPPPLRRLSYGSAFEYNRHRYYGKIFPVLQYFSSICCPIPPDFGHNRKPSRRAQCRTLSKKPLSLGKAPIFAAFPDEQISAPIAPRIAGPPPPRPARPKLPCASPRPRAGPRANPFFPPRIPASPVRHGERAQEPLRTAFLHHVRPSPSVYPPRALKGAGLEPEKPISQGPQQAYSRF
jgi:hypothetical protein